jgi:hypothetical protein
MAPADDGVEMFVLKKSTAAQPAVAKLAKPKRKSKAHR